MGAGPVMGACPENPEVTPFAKEDTLKALNVLNNHLLHNTYMVGHNITLADITVCCALLDGMKHVLDESIRGKYGNLMRWFNHCIGQAEFKQVLGDVKLCGKAAGGGKPAAAPKKEAQ